MKITFKNKALDLSTPAVMGILNVTPDSFYDGGKYFSLSPREGDGVRAMMIQTEKMISEGADIIDIGACSTRPGAKEVSVEEELKRLIPAIKLVRKKFAGIIISVDTFRSTVAEEAVNAGADMINDISGGSFDKKMFATVGKLQVPYVLMHIHGTPQIMQKIPIKNGVIGKVFYYFANKMDEARAKGVKQIILDPGFGFGKSLESNYELLANLDIFSKMNRPILVGISRKSMINKVLGIKPEEALNGTTVANTIALMNGANILRVHDVKEAKEAVKIFNRIP